MGVYQKIIVVAAAFLVVGALAAGGAWMLESKRVAGSGATEQAPSNEFVADLPEQVGVDLVIQCNEEFFREAYKRFREEHLGIDTEPIAVPGGIKALAAVEAELPKELAPVKRAIIEALKRNSPRRIVLTAHSYCLIYDVIAAWQNEPGKARERQLSDLEKARNLIQEWFPNTKIDVYYADRDGNKLRFRPILTTAKEVK